MKGAPALRGRGEPIRLHVGELVGRDLKDGGVVVVVVGEIHVDRVCADVWVFGRVYSREVLVLDEDRAMCQGHRGEGERALPILAGRRVVEVDGVSVENVVAVSCREVDVFVDFADVEWGVVVIADGKGDDVSSSWL